MRGVDSFKFAALDTLQHRLSGDAKRAHCFSHGQEALASVAVEAGLEVIGEANAPGGARGEPLARDEAVVEQAMDGRGRNAEQRRGLADGQQLACCVLGLRLEAWDPPVAAQIADTSCIETMTVSGPAPLTVENAGDDGVGIMDGKPAEERDGVLIGADGGWPRAWQRHIDLTER